MAGVVLGRPTRADSTEPDSAFRLSDASGYDHFFGILGCCADYFNHGADASRAYDHPLYGPGLASQLHEQEVPIERHGYMTNLLGDRAVQTVESYAKSRESFLLSLHFTA